jgi:outer membrane lipoprotein-sorting protein
MLRKFLFPLLTISSFFAPLARSEPERLDDSVEIAKIKQGLFPLKTFSGECVFEEIYRGKIVHKEKYILELDFNNKRFFWENSPEKKSDSTLATMSRCYASDEKITQIWMRKRLDSGKNYGTAIAEISKEDDETMRLKIPPVLKSLFSYNAITERESLPYAFNGYKELLDIREVNHEGKQAVQIHYSRGTGPSKVDFVFLFSKQTGLLLEKKITFKPKNGDAIQSILTPKKYILSNGICFPEIVEITQGAENIRRITVNKETVRINEPIDPKEFIPKIPGGANVHDKINGIEYTTPVVGNPEAMKELEANLNACFEDADNEKPQKATKPATK